MRDNGKTSATGRRWATIALLLGVAASGCAWADRGRHFHDDDDDDRIHGSVHVFVGVPAYPLYYGTPYYYPYHGSYPYYPPPLGVGPPAPPAYIEREPELAGPALAPGYWYYCSRPKGYYPRLKECPGGWQQVAPPPPR